ncbi:arylsulfatase [Bremerella cremea]|uniref:Arylsulfatase n=1 Tax=Blastopirellula marina TaxID=124 RepID=A0A2S8FKQ0_9BACT|nr:MULTISPECIES: arylsulfatase [Pirellulaceae]PQO32731.1 arylsulfatase [Blastopirellula marina]RCS45798.1 arylsulfatase [Bremerella cremea]
MSLSTASVRLLLGFWFAVCLLIFTAPALADEAKRPPNIVFILADDLGYSELGSYGQEKIHTPNLDKLAQEGMRFTDFYCGNAVCAPSRCVFMTGKHGGHAYVRDNGDPGEMLPETKALGAEFPGQNPIPAEEVTIAEVLKQKGYATAAIGKWGLGHFGSTGDPNKQGFDLFYGFNCQRHAHNHYPNYLWRNREKEVQPGNDRTLKGETYSQSQFRDVAIEFIEENAEKPFFLYLPFAVPHLSIQVPDEDLEEYADMKEDDYEHHGYLKHPKPHAGYAAMISHMDRDIGMILDTIKAKGLEDNTVVLFSSDNGPTYDRLGGSDSDFFVSSANFKGLKGSLYEGGIRVPLIVRWPGKVKPGSVSDHPAAFYDLMPTFAQIAGVKTPEGIDGISLVPELLGQDQPEHDYLYWEFRAYGGQQAVRMGDWKAIRQNMMRPRQPNAGKLELYNLKDDPSESKDVAGEHPEIVAKAEAAMKKAHTPSKLFPIPMLGDPK